MRSAVELEAEYLRLKEQRDAEYWRFTRCASYPPHRMAELSKLATEKRREWMDALHGRTK